MAKKFWVASKWSLNNKIDFTNDNWRPTIAEGSEANELAAGARNMQRALRLAYIAVDEHFSKVHGDETAPSYYIANVVLSRTDVMGNVDKVVGAFVRVNRRQSGSYVVPDMKFFKV